MLNHYEKSIIPGLVNFCKGTFRNEEWKYSFGQIRSCLAAGLIDQANEDII